MTMRIIFIGLASASMLVGACSDDDAPPPIGDAGFDARTRDAAPPDSGFDAGCAPSCEGRSCGDDGCGGSCGPCDGFCSADGACLDSPSCPATGPFGTNEGDIAADAVLYDCDGNEVRLHALCDAGVSWIFEFADWCPPCRSFARDDAENIWTTYSSMGVAGYFVISADGDFNAPTQSLCNEIRDRYSLTMPVLFDPDGNLQTALGINSNAWNVVLTEGMQIRWKGKYAEAMVPAQLDAALAE